MEPPSELTLFRELWLLVLPLALSQVLQLPLSPQSLDCGLEPCRQAEFLFSLLPA